MESEDTYHTYIILQKGGQESLCRDYNLKSSTEAGKLGEPDEVALDGFWVCLAGSTWKVGSPA